MPAKINLLNQKFGKLTVLEQTPERKNKSVVWKCQCECGKICFYSTKELRSDGLIQCPQCGHDRNPKTHLLKDIVGEKYNHLTVLEKTNKTAGGKILYKCKCDCGNPNFSFVSRTDLTSGHIKSCGCERLKYHVGDIINNKKILSVNADKHSKNHYYSCECLLCGRKYQILGSSIEKSFSCGCIKSKGQYNITQILNQNDIKYYREYQFPGYSYRFDFAILNNQGNIIRLIQFDGQQHYEENIKNSGWNTIQKFQYTLENDIKKNKIAKQHNIPLVRIPYWERYNITLDLLFSDKYLV